MLDITKDQRTIASQREQIEELQEEVRQLREAISPALLFPGGWRLSPIRARLLQALYAAPEGFMTHDQLFTALACQSDGDSPRLVAVHVSHTRTHLESLGIPVEIKSRHGYGYEITPASKEIIKEALERRAEH